MEGRIEKIEKDGKISILFVEKFSKVCNYPWVKF